MRRRFEPNIRTTNTTGQRAVAEAIRRLGMIPGMEVEFSPYFVDVYIGEAYVAVEYDGPGWHTFHKRDRERDAFLWETYSLPVLRVKIDNITELTPLIKEFVDKWASSAKQRKERYLGCA